MDREPDAEKGPSLHTARKPLCPGSASAAALQHRTTGATAQVQPNHLSDGSTDFRCGSGLRSNSIWWVPCEPRGAVPNGATSCERTSDNPSMSVAKTKRTALRRAPPRGASQPTSSSAPRAAAEPQLMVKVKTEPRAGSGKSRQGTGTEGQSSKTLAVVAGPSQTPGDSGAPLLAAGRGEIAAPVPCKREEDDGNMPLICPRRESLRSAEGFVKPIWTPAARRTLEKGLTDPDVAYLRQRGAQQVYCEEPRKRVVEQIVSWGKASNALRQTWVSKYASLEVITDLNHPAKVHGLKVNREVERGVFAKQWLRPWTLLGEFSGTVRTLAEHDAGVGEVPDDFGYLQHDKMFDMPACPGDEDDTGLEREGLDLKLIIDGGCKGNCLAFLNDVENTGREANVKAVSAWYGGEPHVYVITLGHVKTGDELLLDYGEAHRIHIAAAYARCKSILVRDIEIKQHVKDIQARDETIRELEAALKQEREEHHHIAVATAVARKVGLAAGLAAGLGAAAAQRVATLAQCGQLYVENEKLKAERAAMQQELVELRAKVANSGTPALDVNNLGSPHSASSEAILMEPDIDLAPQEPEVCRRTSPAVDMDPAATSSANCARETNGEGTPPEADTEPVPQACQHRGCPASHTACTHVFSPRLVDCAGQNNGEITLMNPDADTLPRRSQGDCPISTEACTDRLATCPADRAHKNSREASPMAPNVRLGAQKCQAACFPDGPRPCTGVSSPCPLNHAGKSIGDATPTVINGDLGAEKVLGGSCPASAVACTDLVSKSPANFSRESTGEAAHMALDPVLLPGEGNGGCPPATAGARTDPTPTCSTKRAHVNPDECTIGRALKAQKLSD